MEILVYEKPEKSHTQPPLILKLVRNGASVQLIVVNQEGNPRSGGIICTITPDGEMLLRSGIQKDFGIVLDSRGKIKIAD